MAIGLVHRYQLGGGLRRRADLRRVLVLFYFAAVALIGGALGYAVGVGLMEAIGLDFGFLVWAVGIVRG